MTPAITPSPSLHYVFMTNIINITHIDTTSNANKNEVIYVLRAGDDEEVGKWHDALSWSDLKIFYAGQCPLPSGIHSRQNVTECKKNIVISLKIFNLLF